MTSSANLFVAYFLWFFLGWTGLHLFYVGRDNHMLIYLTTFGGFSFGWIQDMWRLPSYCEQHTDGTPTNPGVAELEFHKINMKTNPSGPSKWQFGRFMGSLVVSIFYGYVTSSMFDLSFLNECTVRSDAGANVVCNYRQNSFYWFIPLLLSSLKAQLSNKSKQDE